jgi:hypothetical protein
LSSHPEIKEAREAITEMDMVGVTLEGDSIRAKQWLGRFLRIQSD